MKSETVYLRLATGRLRSVNVRGRDIEAAVVAASAEGTRITEAEFLSAAGSAADIVRPGAVTDE